MARTNDKYFKGVVKETSANLQLWVKRRFATLPNSPIKINKLNSYYVGITHPPNGKVKRPMTPEQIEK